MPISLPQGFKDEGERPRQTSPWIWLYEIQVIPPAVGVQEVLFRFTNFPEQVYWPNAVVAPPGKHWYPFPITQTPVEESGEGDLPQIDLSVSNVSREVMPYMHTADGFQGNLVTAYLINYAGKDIAYPAHEFLQFDFEIAGSSANAEAVTFRLELPNFFNRKSPQNRYSASRCRWKFGGPECAYPVNAAAAFTSCGKTPDDCIARGDDEAARNLPVLHPLRFGAFLGIPQQRNL